MQQDGFIMKKLPKILFVDDEQSVLKGIELNLGGNMMLQWQTVQTMHLS